MGMLEEEVKKWNSPIIGAYLLWNFTKGYCENHPTGDAPIGLLHFVALPILINKELNSSITNRLEDLQSYVLGFEKKKKCDLLFTIHDRILSYRDYTLASIDTAIAKGLLYWDFEYGKLYYRNIDEYSKNLCKIRGQVEADGKKANILGKWFSKHNLSSIAAYLKVVF